MTEIRMELYKKSPPITPDYDFRGQAWGAKYFWGLNDLCIKFA